MSFKKQQKKLTAFDRKRLNVIFMYFGKDGVFILLRKHNVREVVYLGCGQFKLLVSLFFIKIKSFALKLPFNGGLRNALKLGYIRGV